MWDYKCCILQEHESGRLLSSVPTWGLQAPGFAIWKKCTNKLAFVQVTFSSSEAFSSVRGSSHTVCPSPHPPPHQSLRTSQQRPKDAVVLTRIVPYAVIPLQRSDWHEDLVCSRARWSERRRSRGCRPYEKVPPVTGKPLRLWSMLAKEKALKDTVKTDYFINLIYQSKIVFSYRRVANYTRNKWSWCLLKV